ncbi:Uncharacterized protein FWK35_00023408, partial [Aphis craccivora]
SRHLLTTLGDTQGRRWCWCCCRWCCRRYRWCHTPEPRFLASGGDPYAYSHATVTEVYERTRAHTYRCRRLYRWRRAQAKAVHRYRVRSSRPTACRPAPPSRFRRGKCTAIIVIIIF